MKPDSMRLIDYYAGVPICFSLHILSKLFSIFPRTKKEFPKRVLLIEISEMGSAILVDPAMQKLKKETNAELFFLIFKKNAPSLHILQTVKKENILTIRDNNFFTIVTDVLKFIWQARSYNFDTCIDLELFSRFTSILTFFSGATTKVGFYKYHSEGLYRGEFLTHKVQYNAHIHIAKNFLALVNSLLSKNVEVPYSKTPILDEEIKLNKVTISADSKKIVLEKIKKFVPSFSEKKNSIVLINANASDLLPQRRWPYENYSSLIKMILSKTKNDFVILTGSPNEKATLDSISKEVNSERCINFAGGVEFHELTTLYSLSKLMISNDSGPPHFASVTNLPTFVLFGPETPSLYGSLGNFFPIYAGLPCSPCVSAMNHRKTSCVDNICLKIITPMQVFKTIEKELLKK
ncbi:MAG: glycosyltransferase family 9 protein [Leptospiraceae bacterium]|nr:glycosyltransferase family 9 protein [Leptospiraceae bacterium]